MTSNERAEPMSINKFDAVIVGAGLLSFLFSFLPYYTATVLGVSVAGSAWHGFFGWAAVVLAIAGSLLVFLDIRPDVNLRIPLRAVGLSAYALSLVFVIVAAFVFPNVGVANIHTGRGIGFWLDLVAIIIGLICSLMRFQATGGELPGPLSKFPDIGYLAS